MVTEVVVMVLVVVVVVPAGTIGDAVRPLWRAMQMHRIQGSGVARHSVTRSLSAGEVSHATSQAALSPRNGNQIFLTLIILSGIPWCCDAVEHSKTYTRKKKKRTRV